MHHPQKPASLGYVFGFDPRNPIHAAHIATHGQDFTPLQRAVAWRALLAARGQVAHLAPMVSQIMRTPHV